MKTEIRTLETVAAQGQHQLLAQVEAQGQQHAGRGRTADERRGVIQRLPQPQPR